MSKSIHVWVKSSVMWHCITVQVIPNISKDHSVFKQSQNGQPGSEDKGTTMFQKVGYLSASNQEGPSSTLGQSMWNFFTQSGTGREGEFILQVLQSFPVNFIPPLLHTHISFTKFWCYAILASERVVK